MSIITVMIAFAGGLLSFFSPCILPLAPGYLGMISGVSIASLKAGTVVKRKILSVTIAFVLGFSLVFIVLGLAGSLIGQLFRGSKTLFSRIGGIIVILLGLHQAGLMPINWLYRERRVSTAHGVGVIGAFLTGLTFAFGWTPCVGPILGGILTMAGNQKTVGAGFILLIVYSLGLAIPFLLLAMGFEQASGKLNRVKPYLKYLQWTAGGLLIIMGILLVTNNLTLISSWIMRITGGWNPESLFGK
jgi:cytochrome c-type biogenesis protein